MMAEVGKEGRKGTIEVPGRSRRTEETKRPLKTENPIDNGKCTEMNYLLIVSWSESGVHCLLL